MKLPCRRLTHNNTTTRGSLWVQARRKQLNQQKCKRPITHLLYHHRPIWHVAYTPTLVKFFQMVLRYTFLVFTEAPYGSGSKCSLRFIGGWWPCFSTNQCCKILKSYILDLVLTDSKHWLIAKRLLLRWTSVFNFKSIGFTVQDVLSKCVFLCPFFCRPFSFLSSSPK